MAKKFRLFEGEDLTHWQDRAGDYNANIIKSIRGGDIDKAKNFPTSIPSPFARLDLFRAAFASFENPEMELDGDSNNHRIIGECLDLLELLYNYDNVKDHLKIVVWDKSEDLPKLENSNSLGHQLLAKTLRLFLNQDNAAFHFDQFSRFYIFYWDGFVLGGTSPKSLVFTSANSREFSAISVEEDVLFSGTSKPLYKRNKDFIKYLVSLFFSNEILKRNMNEFYAYIEKNLEQIQRTDHSFFNELDSLDLNSINDFAEISHESIYLEVFNIPFRKIKKADLVEKISNESEFLIHSSKSIQGAIPMVLVENGHLGHLKYLNNKTNWDVNQKVQPTKLPLENRELPGKAIKYPYYTVDDFLASEIYELPYKINSNQFFDGNFVNETAKESVGYLLPLTQTFFDLFYEEDLWTKRYSGLPMIEIVKRNSFVQVVLRIPINRGRNHLELIKRYVTDDANLTQGIIKTCQKYVSIYPFVKSIEYPNYYVQIIDEDRNDSSDYLQLQLRYDSNLPMYSSLKSKYGKNGSFYNTVFQQVTHNFNKVLLKQVDSIEGNYLIPRWQDAPQSSDVFTFAIDFGTSNTHVEYSKNQESPKSLHFNSDKNGYGYSFPIQTILGKEQGELLDFEFFPREINKNFAINFPIRTVLFKYGDFKATDYKPILDYNIGFYYEKTPLMKSNKSSAETNLKWINDKVSNHEQKAWVYSFLEQLVVQCKAKILLEGGNISGSKFVWTYPLSYSSKQVTDISNQLDEIIGKHFGDNIVVQEVCESIAPFYYISNEGKLLGSSSNILALDVGGGTIDSVVYQNNEVKSISSMLFGANYLYGNGYEKSIHSNVFFRLGEEFINAIPEIKEKTKLIREEIVLKENMEDIISFYYSLENRQDFKDKKNISFSNFLKESNEIRTVFLFYYSSILHYNLRAMKANGQESPSKLIFSGNGSKFIEFLDGSKGKLSLADYTEYLIKCVFKKPTGQNVQLTIFTNPHPKELTSKGAISLLKEDDSLVDSLRVRRIDHYFKTYIGDKNNTVVSFENLIPYEKLDQTLIDSVIEEYIDFSKMFMDQSSINLRNLFNIETNLSGAYTSILTNRERALEFIETGIKLRKKQVTDNERISDPLFFYIIRGMLGDILQKINENGIN